MTTSRLPADRAGKALSRTARRCLDHVNQSIIDKTMYLFRSDVYKFYSPVLVIKELGFIK